MVTRNTDNGYQMYVSSESAFAPRRERIGNNMTQFMSTQSCLLCRSQFQTKDLRTELCPSCKVHEKEVKKYRGLGGRLNEATKQKILDSKTLRIGTGYKYDFFDKGGRKPEEKKPWRPQT